MKRTTIGAVLAICGVASLAAPDAEAKGCIRGAVAGGIAGHYAGHHGVVGAVAGCVAARHYYKEKAKQGQEQQHAAPAAAAPAQ